MDAAIAALSGALIGAISSIAIGIYAVWRNNKEEAKKAQRKYLTDLMLRLIDARAEYDAFLSEHSLHIERLKTLLTNKSSGAVAEYEEFMASQSARHGSIIGKASSACLAVGDDVLTRIAIGPVDGPDDENSLTPYFVHTYKKRANDKFLWRERNRNLLADAVRRLSELIEKANH